MISIRRKLFVQISSIVLLFILLLFLANTFLLENIYIQGTKSRITEIYDEINLMEKDAITSEYLFNYLIESRTFMELLIIDEETGSVILPLNEFLAGSNPDYKPQNVKLPPINQITIEKEEVISDKITLLQVTDPRNNNTFFVLSGYLDNGYKIEIRVPLASISQNVAFFNQFILGSGVIILIMTFIAANFSSKHFTKPIQNMTKVTDHIKKMDFSQTCEVTTNDEIGRLAENINEMSYALKENIHDLESSNKQLTIEIDERMKIDEQRKALLNNVSHELKTPLSLVQGYSEGLKLNLHKNPEKTDFYCDVIIDEAKKMDMLVSQLLDINHMQFGDFPLHKEKTDAKAFIDYILTKQQPFIDEAGLKLKKSFSVLEDTKDMQLHIDVLRSEQVITNLLNNAIAYVDDNQELWIKAEELIDSETTHIRLTVSNSYQQVGPEELDNWWNSFYKADKARTRENGGYGLGLSIIKAVQEADQNQYGVYWDNGMIHFYVDFDLVS